jgi:hypothetical protein
MLHFYAQRFLEISCRLASVPRIRMNVMGTLHTAAMQVSERYEHSDECVGNAPWKRSVQKYTFNLHSYIQQIALNLNPTP